MRMLLTAVALLFLVSGCASVQSSLKSLGTTYGLLPRVPQLVGRIDAARYETIPAGASFYVVRPDSVSLQERRIADLITSQMVSRGLRPADKPEDADVAVIYEYSVGQGRTRVYSRTDPDFIFGGTETTVRSTTTYPRKFAVALADVQASKGKSDIVLLWQAEVRSQGLSQDIARLAPYFIEEIFKRYGRAAENESFTRPF